MKMNEDRVDRGWMRMTAILDESKPQKKKKRRPIVLWWLGMTFLIAAVLLITNSYDDTAEKKQSLVASSYPADSKSQDLISEGGNQASQTKLKPASTIKAERPVASANSVSTKSPVISKLPLLQKSVIGANNKIAALQPPLVMARVKREISKNVLPLSPRKIEFPEHGSVLFDLTGVDNQKTGNTGWYLSLSANKLNHILRPGCGIGLGLEKSLGNRWSWQSELSLSMLGSVRKDEVDEEWGIQYSGGASSLDPAVNSNLEALLFSFPSDWNHLGLLLGIKKFIRKRWALGVHAQYQYFPGLPVTSNNPNNTESRSWIPAIGADLTYQITARWHVRLVHRKHVLPIFQFDDQSLYLDQWQLGVQYFWSK